jgi:hypothetical protein
MPPVRILQRSSLRSFLGLAKSTLESAIKGSTPITFVLGNESAGKKKEICKFPGGASPLTDSPTDSVDNFSRPRLALQHGCVCVSTYILATLSFSNNSRPTVESATGGPRAAARTSSRAITCKYQAERPHHPIRPPTIVAVPSGPSPRKNTMDPH